MLQSLQINASDMRDSISKLLQQAFPEIKAQQHEHGEKDQAKIRFVVACLLGLYCIYYVDPSITTASTSQSLITIFIALSICAVTFYAWIIKSPTRNPLRIVLAMTVDLGLLSYAMSIAGAYGGPWYPVYLWVTFGNGFRYGIKYLFIATAISVIGFSAVLVSNIWWHSHIATGVGLLIGLIILPLYVSSLLRSLQAAISSANDANNTKSRFLANMSHELRTPLNGVIATADLLKNTVSSGESKEMINTISNSAEALLDLINQILDIGKIEAGKMQVEKTQFQLRNLLKSTVDIVSPSSEKKGLELYTQIDANIPDELIGDPTQTRQILINLLSNAVKFTHDGYISIRAVLNKIDDSTATIKFEISDTGIGIKENAQSRIFDAFTQADESTTREYGGTGLGTAICKELTELMGGQIKLTSTPDVGTTFTITIPYAYKNTNINSQLLSGLHIVAIGNPITSKDIPTKTLREWGILVEHTADNETACRLVEQHRDKTRPVNAILISGNTSQSDLFDLSNRVSSRKNCRGVSLIAIGNKSENNQAVKNSRYVTCLDSSPTELQLYNAIISCNLPEDQTDPCTNIDTQWSKEASKHLHILVADDNATNRKVISMVLKQFGHHADIVNDGSKALDALENKTYDAVIVDMHMPVLGGIEVFKTHRFSHPESRLPFILLTADATSQAIELARDVGFDSYITKPFRPNELHNILHKITHDSHTTHTPKQQAANSNSIIGHETSNLLDFDVLNQLILLSENNPDFVSELIFGFINDAKQTIALMETSISTKNYEEFNDYAHALKGSSGSVGAKSIYEICAEIGKTNYCDLPEIGPILTDKIKLTFSETKNELIKYSQGLSMQTAIYGH